MLANQVNLVVDIHEEAVDSVVLGIGANHNRAHHDAAAHRLLNQLLHATHAIWVATIVTHAMPQDNGNGSCCGAKAHNEYDRGEAGACMHSKVLRTDGLQKCVYVRNFQSKNNPNSLTEEHGGGRRGLAAQFTSKRSRTKRQRCYCGLVH